MFSNREAQHTTYQVELVQVRIQGFEYFFSSFDRNFSRDDDDDDDDDPAIHHTYEDSTVSATTATKLMPSMFIGVISIMAIV